MNRKFCEWPCHSCENSAVPRRVRRHRAQWALSLSLSLVMTKTSARVWWGGLRGRFELLIRSKYEFFCWVIMTRSAVEKAANDIRISRMRFSHPRSSLKRLIRGKSACRRDNLYAPPALQCFWRFFDILMASSYRSCICVIAETGIMLCTSDRPSSVLASTRHRRIFAFASRTFLLAWWIHPKFCLFKLKLL